MTKKSANKITSVSFKTIGCKFNQSETDALMTRFKDKGIVIKNFGEPVDLTIINTCTVTHAADRDCRNLIRQAMKHSPNARIVVTGCYAQISPSDIENIHGVDLILGNKEKFSVFDFLDLLQTKQDNPILCVNNKSKKISHDSFLSATTRTRAFLKVQEGCNFFCSYCIVPFVRGAPKSVSYDAVINEAKELVSKGFLELVLTGINVGLYFDKENNKKLTDLVDGLQNINGVKRIRLSSLEPNTINDSLLELMANSKIICPHLHIPLQAGDDKVLKAMKRKYLTYDYKNLIERILKLMPNIALGADVIVGFPTESDEHFNNTYEFIKSIPYSYLHVFSYSDRSGTVASKIKDKVDPKIKKQRSKALLALSQEKKQAYFNKNLGLTKAVYFDQEKGDLKLGYTNNYIRVAVKSDKIKRGDFVKVMLDEVDNSSVPLNVRGTTGGYNKTQ